ncbi:glycosyltransferase [Methyloferula stellata]|uniref:glycosyltransferase n=1 Tax=Methyloferula stellata TaxID=876270 RepID=UPI00035E0F54|nr:glycosyltransferase [Methyloferula stellata]
MLISTIILNWNRALLLEQTLRSYAATAREPYEIVVVDNGSTDNSRTVIESLRHLIPKLKSIFLPENLGGEAINVALDKAAGDLIHISENDQLFGEGWSEHARHAFLCFPDLGQLSLHGISPPDEEAWAIKSAHLRFANGKILYEAQGNVGTSSIIRSSLIRDAHIRIYNIPTEHPDAFKFPDDGRLSDEIKQTGYWCAWSERYYVRNLGHELEEFARDPDYYRENYQSKSWLGLDGWQKRIATAQARRNIRRHSIVFPQAHVQPEKTQRQVATKPAQFWSMFDGFTAETEVLDFLYALIRMVKPENAIETGTWLGRSAAAIASGMRDNGFGRLFTIEHNEQTVSIARQLIDNAQLNTFVEIHIANSLEFDAGETRFQFALFDSEISIRAEEFRKFYDRLEPGATVVFHDTAEQHPGSADNVIDLKTMGLLEGMFFETPRGLFVGQVLKPAQPKMGGVLRGLPRGFSAASYLDANPDLAVGELDAAEHYRTEGWRDGRKLAPDWSLDGKRLVLTVTPGRSGTGYLAALVNAIPGIDALHEPEPKFSDVMRLAQHDQGAAKRFWLTQKLPAIRRSSENTYVETSHLACKGFIEPLLDNHLVPDLIILERDPFLVATSLYLLDTVPARTSLGEKFLLRPDDPNVSPLEGWQDLHDWALCFWYCREIERRMKIYAKLVEQHGGRVIATSIEALATQKGLHDMTEFLASNAAPLQDSEVLQRQTEVVNEKADLKIKLAIDSEMMLDLARDVDRRLSHSSQFQMPKVPA